MVTVRLSDHFEYQHYNLHLLAKSVDFMNFIHDYRWFMESYKINDALESMGISNAEDKVGKLIDSGMPASKIVMGIHFTGPIFSISRDNGNSQYQGTYGLNTVCKMQQNRSKWEKCYDVSGLNIFRNEIDKKAIVIESRHSIVNKVCFAIKRGLAGIMPMYVLFDHIDCDCGTDSVSTPYVEGGVSLTLPGQFESKVSFLFSIHEAIGATLEEISQEENMKVATETTSTTTTISTTTLNQETATDLNTLGDTEKNRAEYLKSNLFVFMSLIYFFSRSYLF